MSYSAQPPGPPPGPPSQGKPPSQARRRPRSSSVSTTPSYSKSSAAAAAVAGAVATTALDKYLFEERERDPRSKDDHDRHGDQTLRRLADLAIGGAVGVGAYTYFRDTRATPEETGGNGGRHGRHRSSDMRHRRAKSVDRRDDHFAHERGYDDHPIRHALETGGGAYGVGKELMRRDRERDR